MRVLIFTVLFSSWAQASECNNGLELEAFKTQALSQVDYQAPLSDAGAEGLDLAIEIFWDFRAHLTADSSMCTNKLHVYDHVTTLMGFDQNSFTRFPPDNMAAAFTIGSGLGIDASFLELGAQNPRAFRQALRGILVYFSIDKKEANGFGRAYAQLGYDENAKNVFREISHAVCKTAEPEDCVHLAMYRLMTFELATNGLVYLEKGSSLEFAQILLERGEVELAQKLLRVSKSNKAYFAAYMQVHPQFSEEAFQTVPSLK